ncbi:alpha/beta fold hydrolase [Paenibacillus polysaccharolyticus]|uniref:S9 family peptidase n=1 Tax=Paenibacillus polysaccharolyticus TaxID=582692 RepID=UPI002041C2A6|nr:alpha/beta fold hydrolase [Paenibacillus polysaccharolyticus]MCM3135183.1 alpha/beta fold hydrolase [Paenibacillus polysaccharolyticus]
MIQFPKPDVEQYFQTYRISHFAVSADEKKLYMDSNLNGQPNIWAMDLPGGYPYPLTYLNQSSQFIKADPQGRHLLTAFDRDGNENYHLYALPPEGGVPLPIVPADPSDRCYYAHLSEDGKRLYYNTSSGNPNYMNARLRDLETGEDKLLYQGEEVTSSLIAVSPNEEAYVILKMYSNTYQTAHLHRNGESHAIVPVTERQSQVPYVLFAGNDRLLLITNDNSAYAYVAEYVIDTGEFRALCHIEGEDVEEIRWHEASETLFIWTMTGPEYHMYVLEKDAEKPRRMDMPLDTIEQVNVTKSGNVYILGRGAVQPHNIYRLVADAESWEPLTANRVTGLNPDDLVYPDVVRYNSYDGLEIEALLFKAKPEKANGYSVFWPHGGPQASEAKFLRPMFQLLLAQGYNLFAPNFRGSTGYGAEFVKMVERDWGEGPRLDCVAGIQWLFDQAISSPERLFVVGGSYGGYMTLLLAGRHPELFRAAVDIFGPCNLFTFLESVPEDWKPMMDRWLGDPVRDRERLTKDSPITYLDQMVNPMLVIQGANDPRVVKAESDQIVAALQEKGVDVEYIVLDDEGHGFSRKTNEILVYRKMVEFLQKHQETPVAQV